jgi:sugar-specific transcriptional regulator TrmB
MKKVTEFLKQLGLSEIESKLYEGLLDMGSTTVMELANKVGIKRITAHFNIESLIEKGLVVQTRKGARRQIIAEDPEKLIDIIEQKEEEIGKLKQSLPYFIDKIRDQIPAQTSTSETEVNYYEGKSLVKKIYDDALSFKELRTYANLTEMQKYFPENLDVFNKAMRTNPDLQVLEIVEDTQEARAQISISSKNDTYFYKFLPKGYKLTAADILIYEGKVAIITARNPVTGIVIKSDEYYQNSKNIFDLLWQVLK